MIYLKYTLQNIEPVRIADDSTSRNGQTVSLKYIPGTTVRGLVMNKIASAYDEVSFQKKKRVLLSNHVKFLNAYLTVEENGTKIELMPSLKGFYEKKSPVETEFGSELENVVVSGEFSEGSKRAALGRFCYLTGKNAEDAERSVIKYYNVETGSDMKIKIVLDNEDKKKGEKQNVFRNEYIAENHLFTGYIAVDLQGLDKEEADAILADIKKAIGENADQTVIIGNARTGGLGKCKVLFCDYTDEDCFVPYEEYLPEEDLTEGCYMMLLSNTTMRDSMGELCGLDCKQLEEIMGVTDLKVERCSTSTVDVKGYNSTWGVKIPSAVMYEQGSVFYLTYKGVFTKESMLALCHKGIGIRKNEGFGRVLFLKDYSNITYKNAGTYDRKAYCVNNDAHAEDDKVIRLIAKNCYNNLVQDAIKKYVVNNAFKKGSVSASQLGVLLSMASAYRYDAKTGVEELKKYFKHAKEKEDKTNVQKEKASVVILQKTTETILDDDINKTLDISAEKIMGIPVTELCDKETSDKLKLELICELIKYDFKEDV